MRWRRQLLVCVCLAYGHVYVHASRIKDAIDSTQESGDLDADPSETEVGFTPLLDGMDDGSVFSFQNEFDTEAVKFNRENPTPIDPNPGPGSNDVTLPPSPSRRRRAPSGEGDANNKKDYKVLSYNICWGCMEADTGDSTGMRNDLGNECVKYTDMKGNRDKNGDGLNVTRCGANMAQAVERYHTQIGGYDLMGFQEASNFGDMYLKDRLSGSMQYVEYNAPMNGVKVTKGVHKGSQKYAWIVSMYNSDTVGQHDVQIGGYEKTPMAKGSARPYLILIFDRVKLIFINLHNAQPKEGTSWYDFPTEMGDNKKMQQAFQENDARKQYRVILTGDFNDLGAELPGCIVLPWNGATMRIKRPYAQTCCKTEVQKGRKAGSSKKLFPGDYIMDSWSSAYIGIPDSYDPSLPQSDHRPVEGVLKPDDTWTSDGRQDGKCEFSKFSKRSRQNQDSRKKIRPSFQGSRAKGASRAQSKGAMRSQNRKGSDSWKRNR